MPSDGRHFHHPQARVKQHVECVFRYSNAIGKTTSYNPVADLKGVLQTRKVQHRAAISEADLPGFLEALEAYSGDIQTKLGLRLLILPFGRKRLCSPQAFPIHCDKV